MREDNIDCRKYRKSTHLASADLDAMEVEGKKLIFTIKEAWYETAVDVSGDKTDGYFCSFIEPIKNMLINSTNRTVIAGFAKQNGFEGLDCWNIGNWKGIKLEFWVKRDVKMMGTIKEGIRIKPLQPKDKVKPLFNEDNFEKAKEAKATIVAIKKVYLLTPEMEIKYLEYVG